MNIQSNQAQYTARVGNRTFEVPQKNVETAAYYDSNGDHRVTLDEIKNHLKGGLPEGMTANLDDFAIEIRQGLLERPSPHLDHYPTSSEIEAKLKALVKAHPDKAELVTIGKTEEGRDIKALRVSEDVDLKETSAKPSVIITGNIHAREWATNGAVTTAAERYLNGAAPESLENLEVWFVPNANPDGYEYSRDVDPMWRKNTSRDSSGEIVGVDLNRNFPYNYRMAGDTKGSTADDVGASDDPSQLTYRGTSPLSEQESQVIKSFIDQEGDAVGLLDVHGFGRMMLVSEGKFDVPREEYNQIAGAMNKAMKRIDYTVMRDADLYPTTGGLSTYADSLGLVGVTLEMGTSFQPAPERAQRDINAAADGIVEFVRQMEKRASQTA